MDKSIHQIYVDEVDGTWEVLGETPGRLFGTFGEKAQAIDAARSLAKEKHSQLIIRGEGGKMESAEDYASVER